MHVFGWIVIVICILMILTGKPQNIISGIFLLLFVGLPILNVIEFPLIYVLRLIDVIF